LEQRLCGLGLRWSYARIFLCGDQSRLALRALMRHGGGLKIPACVILLRTGEFSELMGEWLPVIVYRGGIRCPAHLRGRCGNCCGTNPHGAGKRTSNSNRPAQSFQMDIRQSEGVGVLTVKVFCQTLDDTRQSLLANIGFAT
jgi:hypothetical protein